MSIPQEHSKDSSSIKHYYYKNCKKASGLHLNMTRFNEWLFMITLWLLFITYQLSNVFMYCNNNIKFMGKYLKFTGKPNIQNHLLLFSIVGYKGIYTFFDIFYLLYSIKTNIFILFLSYPWQVNQEKYGTINIII